MKRHCFNLRDFDFPNPVSYGIGTKCERQSSHVPWIVSDIYINQKKQNNTIEGTTTTTKKSFYFFYAKNHKNYHTLFLVCDMETPLGLRSILMMSIVRLQSVLYATSIVYFVGCSFQNITFTFRIHFSSISKLHS